MLNPPSPFGCSGCRRARTEEGAVLVQETGRIWFLFCRRSQVLSFSLVLWKVNDIESPNPQYTRFRSQEGTLPKRLTFEDS